MKLKIRTRLFISILAGACVSAHANVTPSPLFTDHAVIQRDTDVPVWGKADPGEKVTVSFAGQIVCTTADAQGAWVLNLKPIPAGVHDILKIEGKNVVELKDVVTGDVWVCSGQSNMGFALGSVINAAAEVAAANEPDIRHFGIPNKPSLDPQPDTFVKAAWLPANNPATVWRFTAVGYFFAREIHKETGVPIGILHASWGGTRIQPWMSLETLKEYSGYQRMLDDKKAEIAAWPERKRQLEEEQKSWPERAAAAKAAGQPLPPKPWNPGPPDSGRNMHTQLYNGMIHPLTRYRIKGVLWYQGEGNAEGGPAGAAEYTDLLTRLIGGWRKTWNQGDFPFYYAQLPNWNHPGDPSKQSWAFFREGQANVLSVANTGMAVLIDIGQSNDIHPKNKQEAGRRFALVALNGTYGKSVVAQGPRAASSRVEGNTIRVTFTHAEKGLVAKGGPAVLGFELAGKDGKFQAAEAKIDHDTVVVSSVQVPAPAFVRYAWTNDPKVNLYNGEGLPAAPFRTDK